MKRRTSSHPKMADLIARLGCSLPTATGTLELLWHFAADYAPRGDVGRFGDAQIARAIGYEGDPAELIAALVSSGWLDESDEHRLVIHDWPEHADDYVHLRLARAGLTFADGTEPRKSRMSKAERDRLETAPVKRTQSAQKAHGKATALPVSESKAKAEAEAVIVPAVPSSRRGHQPPREPKDLGAYFAVMEELWPEQPIPRQYAVHRALQSSEAGLPPLDEFRSNIKAWLSSDRNREIRWNQPEWCIRDGAFNTPPPTRRTPKPKATIEDVRHQVIDAIFAAGLDQAAIDSLVERAKSAETVEGLREIEGEAARARVA